MTEMDNAPVTGHILLKYSFQNERVRSSMTEDEWNTLGSDARTYLCTISPSLDKAFTKHSFPPGYATEEWSPGAKMVFWARFNEWIRMGIDPRDHWGMFSIQIPGKTGNQCHGFFNKCSSHGFVFPQLSIANQHCLSEMEDKLFKSIATLLVARAKASTSQNEDSRLGTQKLSPGRAMHAGITLCYAVPILQLFARVDEFIDLCSLQVIQSGRHQARFISHLLDTRYQIESSGSPILIDSILEELGFLAHEQQDVHEMLVRLTGKLLDEFNGTYRTQFCKLVCLDMRSHITEESNEIESIEMVTSVELKVPDHDCGIDELVDSYFQTVDVIKQPQILFLHLLRYKVVQPVFSQQQSLQFHARKITTKINCVRKLRLQPNDQDYTLSGEVYHLGDTIHSGHYVALLYNDTSTILVDGSVTRFVTEDDFVLQHLTTNGQLVLAIYSRDVHIRCSFPVNSDSMNHPRADTCDHWDKQSSQKLSSPLVCNLATARNSGTACQIFRKRAAPELTYRCLSPRSVKLVEHVPKDPHHQFLSTKEKIYIANMAGRGVSVSKIAALTGRHKTTVSRFLSSEKEVVSRTRSSMLHDEKIQGIILNESMTLESKRLSCLRLAERVKHKYGIQMSKETVRQLRRIVGMRFLHPIPQCYLTETHKDNRVVFATNWLANHGHLLRRAPIIFSDESKICLEQSDKRLWRIPGECLDVEYISRQQHPVQIMIWGAVGVGYKSDLFCFEDTCNKETYIAMLESNGIFTGLDNLFGEFQYVFQQDNAPPHVAKQTIAWLKARAHLVENWPPRSPDLNPIEVLWALLKPKIDVSNINTADELFAKTKEAWKTIDQEAVDNICSSFEARLRVVLHLRGNTLNGHWTLVHKVHTALKQTDFTDVDEQISRVLSESTGEERVSEVQDAPLLQLSEMERNENQSASNTSSMTSDDEGYELALQEGESLRARQCGHTDHAEEDINDVRDSSCVSIVQEQSQNRFRFLVESLKGAIERLAFIFS